MSLSREKAVALVESILETHADAVRVDDPKGVEALHNAKLDLIGLVNQIYDECGFDVDRQDVDRIR